MTRRIWQLTDTQKQLLLDFLLLGIRDKNSNPLPILPDHEKNITRIDPQDPAEITGIYRDIWERKPKGVDDFDGRFRDCCPDLVTTYTSEADAWRSSNRASDLQIALWEREDAEREQDSESEGTEKSPSPSPSKGGGPASKENSI